MNPTDSSTTPSTKPPDSSKPPESSKKPPDSSKPRRNHQQTLAGIKTFAGITMNPTDSSKNPPDSSTNQSESSTNPSVLRTIEDGLVVCTCRHFDRFGFLCRHVFCVFKNRDINVITEQYILRRWTRDIIPPELRRKRNRYGEKNVEVERLTNEATSVVDECLFRLGDNVEKMGDFVEKLKKLKTEVEAEVLRTIEDGLVVCTCRHFDRFGFLCRHVFCVFKNRDINVITEQYILRRWTRDIIPPELRRKRNRYGEKNVEVERLTNEATSVVDECLFRLGDNVEKMGDFVEKLKKLRTEVEAEVPNHPSIETGDVIGEHYAISKPNEKTVNNPTKVGNKGSITKKERNKRRKSEKEKALGVKKKQKKKCGFCGVKTNLHTKTTCPDNPNARRKPKPIVS
ncbi:Zinc finger, PMZ-type [Artemisia annua]|uniref:Zinc finger, PMZ-type n=1 Tax=Artemisia annua TaxID=35608 RepID=A0A2U1KSE1_ARTAN|nr:Zinc finger, PMZ-type [Artemisia annua]